MPESIDPPARPLDAVPDAFTTGSTVLVASAGEPSRSALGLRLLARVGTRDDAAVVVTTTESAERTVETFEGLSSAANRPSIGLVDTISEQQSVSARYDAIPVVYTPSASDLERLVMALPEGSPHRPETDISWCGRLRPFSNRRRRPGCVPSSIESPGFGRERGSR